MTLLSDRVHMKATNFGRWSEIAFWKLFLDARILVKNPYVEDPLVKNPSVEKLSGKESFCKGPKRAMGSPELKNDTFN